MKIEILKTVKSDLGFLDKGDVVDVSESTARHYLRSGIGKKVDLKAERRQKKVIEPERQKRKYQRRK